MSNITIPRNSYSQFGPVETALWQDQHTHLWVAVAGPDSAGLTYYVASELETEALERACMVALTGECSFPRLCKYTAAEAIAEYQQVCREQA